MKQFLKTSLQKQQQRSNSLAVDVVHIRRATQDSETVKGYIKEYTQNEVDNKEKKSLLEIHGLYLSVAPLSGDVFSLNGVNYIYESTLSVTNESYKVLVKKVRRS